MSGGVRVGVNQVLGAIRAALSINTPSIFNRLPRQHGTGARPFYGCKSVLTLHREIARKSKYVPHQGKKECARRVRQGLA